MSVGDYVSIGLAVVFLAGTWLIPSLGRRRKAHNAATLHLLAEIEQRGGLMPLSEGDRALIELGGEPTYRPGDRILLASGRIVTGWELAQLAPDLVTVVQSGDVDDFMAEELARCPKFREAYTALAPDDLMVVADAVAEDPSPPSTRSGSRYRHGPTPSAAGCASTTSACTAAASRRTRPDSSARTACPSCSCTPGR